MLAPGQHERLRHLLTAKARQRHSTTGPAHPHQKPDKRPRAIDQRHIRNTCFESLTRQNVGMKTSTAPQARRQSPKPNGFTLIELMMGILGAVAYPSYMDQVRKSRRSDAVAALSAIQQAQERWRANNATYAATIAALGITSLTPGSYYTLSINTTPAPTGASYVATATAASGKSQASDKGCTTLSVGMGNKLVGTTWSTDSGKINYYPETCWSK